MTTARIKTEGLSLSRLDAIIQKFRRNCSLEKLSDWFILSAGTLLAVNGVAQIGEWLGKDQYPGLMEPLFGVPFRSVLLTFGLMNLIVAALCLFTARRMSSFALISWLTINYAVYRIGLSQMDWPHPYPLVSYASEPLDITAQTVDDILAIISVCLLIGVIALPIALRRSAAKKESLKMSCPSCGGHIKFAIRDLGQKTLCPHCRATVILRTPDENLKISCFFCKGHIEFPAHAVGRKLKCPHCNGEITLQEPRTQ